MVECLFMNKVVVGSSPVAVTLTSDFAPASSKEFLDTQATIECRFTLKRVWHDKNIQSWFSLFSIQSFFSLFAIDVVFLRQIWLNTSFSNFLQMFSNCVNVNGIIGAQVWKIDRYGSNMVARKTKNWCFTSTNKSV